MQRPKTLFEDVGDFHRNMQLPTMADGRPRRMDWQEYRYRVAAMQEELREFAEAYASGNEADQADALVDLVYFALGTAHYMRIPFDHIWVAVHQANMQKRRWREGDPVKPRVSATHLDVVKPDGWRPADINTLLDNWIRCEGWEEWES